MMTREFITHRMTRKEILITWLLGSIPLMLIASTISIVVWHFSSQGNPQLPLKPLDYFSSMAFRTPVGWLLSFLTPFGWANILCLFLSLYTKFPALLAGSAIATILSGIYWPMLHSTMLAL